MCKWSPTGSFLDTLAKLLFITAIYTDWLVLKTCSTGCVFSFNWSKYIFEMDTDVACEFSLTSATQMLIVFIIYSRTCRYTVIKKVPVPKISPSKIFFFFFFIHFKAASDRLSQTRSCAIKRLDGLAGWPDWFEMNLWGSDIISQ